METPPSTSRRRAPWLLLAAFLLAGPLASAYQGFSSRVPTTINDFHVPGSQSTDLSPEHFLSSSECKVCHSGFDEENSPYDTWKGSLMGVAALDPLFQAQIVLAEQDAEGVGYFCLRCHAPTSVISGNAFSGTIEAMEGMDFDGVSCHFCHSMVDPRFDPETSPAADEAILAGLAEVPQHFGNAMFVLDPSGERRGARPNPEAAHTFTHSDFFKDAAMCGTCHDVGNVAISRQEDGTFFYNGLDEAAPDYDPHQLFPLERTFTEWSLSAFARPGGVELGGRFGGENVTRVSTCQDCHMPRAQAKVGITGPVRPDAARHEFAGATAWVLEITALHYADDPRVDVAALERGRQAAFDMVARAATIEASQLGGRVRLRVYNETGHKFPTGHIEGRRGWLNVRFLDGQGGVVREIGAYDGAEALLDTDGTRVYEMHVGISEAAAEVTGLPPGPTGHMSLANTIEKDTRIPPRGFNVAAFAAAGAPAVEADYADGQYWDEAFYDIPDGAVRVEARVFYQTVTRAYIEELRDNNHTNDAGQVLYDLWVATDKCPPMLVTSTALALGPTDAAAWLLQ